MEKVNVKFNQGGIRRLTSTTGEVTGAKQCTRFIALACRFFKGVSFEHFDYSVNFIQYTLLTNNRIVIYMNCDDSEVHHP